MKIATWNINSVKARLPLLLDWLAQARPDVVCLQEIKCQTADFPRLELEALGWHCAVQGQKSYNGVALLSREAAVDVITALPGDTADEQARYIEATISGLRIGCLYLPNGNPVGSEKYPYKLAWSITPRGCCGPKHPSCWRGTIISVRRMMMSMIRSAGARTPCAGRNRGRSSVACSTSA